MSPSVISSLLIDFGLVILIWMTQLIVYPSFTYFQSDDLVIWHGKYTRYISIIVMPLMVGQLGFHLFGVFDQFSIERLFSLLLIAAVWINTFFFAVPLHNKIAGDIESLASAKALVRINWFRTIGWTLVFLISFVQVLRNQGPTH